MNANTNTGNAKMTTATQTHTVLITESNGTQRTTLDDGLVAVIVLGDLSLDPATLRQRLIGGEEIESAGRKYRVVSGPGQFSRWIKRDGFGS